MSIADDSDISIAGLSELAQSLLLKKRSSAGAFLNQGLSLDAMVLFEAGIASGQEDFLVAANARIAEAMHFMESVALSTSLYRGVTGVGWLLKTYREFVTIDGTDDFLADLNEHLIEGLTETENLNIDVVDGLSGLIIYATQPTIHPATGSTIELCRQLAESTLRCLKRYAEHQEHGSAKSAYTNLGFAHGMPGLLGCAIALCEPSDTFYKLQKELVLAFERLWKDRIEERGVVDFPGIRGQSAPARMAWCYGILGLALSFAFASKLDPKFRQHAAALAHSCAAKFNAGKHGIEDASLCHGSAGHFMILDHLARSYNITHPDNDLARLRHDAWSGVFMDDDGTPYTCPVLRGKATRFNSLLEGTSGTILALDTDPPARRRWGRLLGIDL